MQTQAMVGGYQGEWQEYQYAEQYAEQLAYPDQYLQQNMQAYDVQAGSNIPQDPRFMTQEEKDRGLGSVFKRDDQRLQQLREKDAREKDPNFISDSYSECYPGYQEYNREVVDSDDEADLSKMDMGGRVSNFWFTYKETECISFYLVTIYLVIMSIHVVDQYNTSTFISKIDILEKVVFVNLLIWIESYCCPIQNCIE